MHKYAQLKIGESRNSSYVGNISGFFSLSERNIMREKETIVSRRELSKEKKKETHESQSEFFPACCHSSDTSLFRHVED